MWTHLETWLILALAGAPLALACDGHDHSTHTHVRRSTGSNVISSPTVPLQWGDFNVIHTTDSHGWLLGHQKLSPPEPNYSGNLGTFASFVTFMKQKALEKDVDLLLVDSGDLHDGNGLTDGGSDNSVDGHAALPFFHLLPYDLMTIGNHELYIYADTLDMYQNFAPRLKGRYLSSNVNITVLDKHGQKVSVPVGERFAKFKTRKGRRITSLGVLFDFTGNDANTTVQPVADMVKEQWFADAIKDEPDLFLLIGHMPVQKDNWPTVFNAVRAVHPLTPILIFGGHTHIRDCVQLDQRSMSLESGRYFETVGWMSANLGPSRGNSNPIKFSRRYLDPNNVTFAFHSGVPAAFAHTPAEIDIVAGLEAISRKFNLSQQYGVAPQDYHVDSAPYPSDASLLSLLGDHVLPVALAQGNNRSNNPHIIITNSGSLRFDVFQGPFTKNDQLIASPFVDFFKFIPNVPWSVAKQVPDQINKSGQDVKKRDWEDDLYKRGHVDAQFNEWKREMWMRQMNSNGAPLVARDTTTDSTHTPTPGYVTKDSCPGVGDDTLHTAIPFFETPNFIASPAPANVTDDTLVDLVYVDFVESDILPIVSKLWNQTVTSANTQNYSPISAKDVFGIYAQQAWN